MINQTRDILIKFFGHNPDLSPIILGICQYPVQSNTYIYLYGTAAQSTLKLQAEDEIR